MTSKILKEQAYKEFLSEMKNKVRRSQIKAALSVNAELLGLYWDMGKMIAEKQDQAKWGDGVVLQLSKDLTLEFPEMNGFSPTNLKYIRRRYLFYSRHDSIGQQAVDLFSKSLKGQQAVDRIKKETKSGKIKPNE